MDRSMKRLFVTGLLFELALLIIGLTWVAPFANRDGAAGPPTAPAPASASATPVASASASAAAGGPVTVTLNQWSVTPSVSTVPAGRVTFIVSNAGTITHEFVVI